MDVKQGEGALDAVTREASARGCLGHAVASLSSVSVDRIYDRFVARLPRSLVSVARHLPLTLGLTSHAETRWSEAFDDPMMAGLPAVLLGETDHIISENTLESASLVHLLSMIGALCIERLHGPGPVDPRIARLHEEAGWARDRAMARLRPGCEHPMTVERIDEAFQRGLERERAVLGGAGSASWHDYRAVAHDKQSMATLASCLAARAAGWSGDDERLVHDVTEGVALGLLHRRHATKWTEEHAREGSWAVALAGCTPDMELERTAEALHEQGVVVRMLEASGRELRRAEEAAAELEAGVVVQWAGRQAEVVEGLARAEQGHPGTVGRWERRRRGAYPCWVESSSAA